MKHILVFLLLNFLILSLFGCTVNQKFPVECLTDTIESTPVPALYIDSQVPQGAVLSMTREDGRYALFAHPHYEITQEIFSAASWEDAFFHVSGRVTQDLRPFLAGNFPHEKYRCTWTVAGETGTNLCQSLIFSDGSFYYAITVECAASHAGEYADAFSDLFAGAQLCGI